MCLLSDLCDVVNRNGYSDLYVVDHNLFVILGRYLMECDEQIFIKERYKYMATCPRCHVLRPCYYFINHTTSVTSHNCAVCRGIGYRSPSMESVNAIIDVTVIGEVDDNLNALTIVMDWFKLNQELSMKLNYAIDVLIMQNSKISASNSMPDTNLNICLFTPQQLIDAIHKCGPYRFTSNGTQRNGARFICSQCKRSRHDNEVESRVRIASSRRLYNCGGYVSYTRSANRMSVRIKHESHHEKAVEQFKLDEDQRAKVMDLAASGMSPFQILSHVRFSTENGVLYHSVYNLWSSVMVGKFKRHNDPHQSAIIYIEECDSLHILGVQSNPFGLAFSTEIANHIMQSWKVTEILIDSTFKTNKQKLELFTVIGSCMGAGFPLAYFLLEAGTGSGLKSREQSLTFFLTHLKNKLQNLNPCFTFTDKETAQIKSLKTVFHVDPSLCLWHMKRSLKMKLKELKKNKLSQLNEQSENALFNLIDTHYFRSTVAFNSSDSDLKTIALRELNEFFFCHPGEREFQTYLQRNWYDNQSWKLWGRRHESKISFSRTTMKVESHWSMIKRLYLLPYNRPGLDLLIHVLATGVMTKYKHDYNAMKSGRNKPYWWRAFVTMWKKCSEAEIRGQYQTDKQNFMCSCPAWLKSQFFICKHLVGDMPCPNYHQVTIRRNPPFLIIDRNSTRLIANIDDEFMGDPSSTVSFAANAVDNAAVDNQLEISFQNEPSIDNVNDLGERLRADVVKLSEWFHNHVLSITSNAADLQQAKYVNDNILPRIRDYKENVEDALRSRTVQRTWHCPDTLYLA